MKQDHILSLAQENQAFTADLRHELHEIPELGWQEEKTLNLIEKTIQTFLKKPKKLELQLCKMQGGIYVDVNIDPSFKRILFRADIDGLPIEEETELPYQSKHKGLMHACGHDCHGAMLLGALKVISEEKIPLQNNLRLVWQRAEEVGTIQSGGSKLVEEGVLEGISYCYGLHISSTEDYGSFISRPGYMMCRAGHLKIGLTCSGGHVMRPELGSNAIDIMSDIHMSLRGFELRKLGPNEIISFVPSISHAGSAPNIRPGKGEMCYAVRNFLAKDKLEEFIASIKYRIELIIKSYPKAELSEFHYLHGYPPLINHPENYAFAKNLLNQAGMKTDMTPYLFSGEDFSYYLQDRVGSYWVLGAKSGERTDHHTSKFNPDETVLWKGVGFWLLLGASEHPEIKMSENIKNLEFSLS